MARGWQVHRGIFFKKGNPRGFNPVIRSTAIGGSKLMKYTSLLLVMVMVITGFGCSAVSTFERENLTRPEAREDYIRQHQNGIYNECIRNGEITRGMSIHEVTASWGFPNVYLVSRDAPEQRCVYYVNDTSLRSVLIYTLTFEDDILNGWDIDMKRFVDYRVAYDPVMPVDTRIGSKELSKKK